MKKLLFIVALALVALHGSSAQVDEAAAMAAAQQFAVQINQGIQRAPSQGNTISLVYTARNRQDASRAVYYIFNSPDRYIIIAGDDRAHEVLAYGDSPLDMNNIPEAMSYWLDCYRQDIEFLQSHPDLVIDGGPRKAPSRAAGDVEPLLTALWDQSAPYYNMCPVSDGQHSLTGCAATSLSMICYYWNYPKEITSPIAAYTTGSLHMTLDALEPTTIDYANMRDRYWGGNYTSVQADAVAKLMRYVGQAEHMDYTPSASGVSSWDISRAIKTLGFDNDATMVFKDNYSDEEWASMLLDELYAGRPLEYCGFSSSSGHAFNVDGYDAERDMYHINWGWSGSGNGHCSLNAFRGGGSSYTHGQLTIIGLMPPATVPTIKVRNSRIALNGVAEKQSTKSFTVKGALLTSGVTLTLNDNTGTFSLDATHINLNELTNGKRVNVTYRPGFSGHHTATVTLSSAGAQDVTVALEGTAVLETYAPRLLRPTDISDRSVNVYWTDGTPAHNISHYRLEMASVPYSDTRLTEDFTTIAGSSNTDISSSLDQLTSAPGWTGKKVYRGDGYLRLGSSTKGWLQTPALDLLDNNDLVTVKVTAKNAGASGESLLKISCADADTSIVLGSEKKEYCVLLPCPASDDATIRLSNRINGHRALIYSLEVMAGDDFTPIDFSKAAYYDHITGKSYHVSNIIPGSYAMRVQATYTDGTQSPWSNRVDVHVDSAIGDVNMDGEINIADTNAVIGVIMGSISNRNTIAASDLNDDGEVNIMDVNLLIGIILNSGV